MGRALRREVGRLLRPHDVKNALRVIRVPDTPLPQDVSSRMTVVELRAALEAAGATQPPRSARKADLIAALSSTVLEGTAPQGGPGIERAVTIPRSIAHWYIPCRTSELDCKMEVKREKQH